MPRVQLGDVEIAYRIDGDPSRPWLVLSNSLGSTLAMWDPQVDALARRFRVLRYDSRGHGESSVPRAPCSIDAMTDDAMGLIDHLGIASAQVCGLSMGGMIGMRLASTLPDRVDRLVLCNTAAHMPPASAWNDRITRICDGGMAAVADQVVARWFSPRAPVAQPQMVARAKAMLMATPAEGYIAACEAIRDMDQRDGIGAIRAPTLVVAGTDDVSTPPSTARDLVARIGGARYVELPAGHMSNLECPTAFTAALVDFLTE
jgi:3-oxoadipate enol-lactonase